MGARFRAVEPDISRPGDDYALDSEADPSGQIFELRVPRSVEASLDLAVLQVRPRHPNGLFEAEYHRLLVRDPSASGWGWRRMRRNAGVYARGTVRHPDHATIVLPGWHEVPMNTETQARTMANVAFLDGGATPAAGGGSKPFPGGPSPRASYSAHARMVAAIPDAGIARLGLVAVRPCLSDFSCLSFSSRPAVSSAPRTSRPAPACGWTPWRASRSPLPT